jgi:hypothetical protein
MGLPTVVWGWLGCRRWIMTKRCPVCVQEVEVRPEHGVMEEVFFNHYSRETVEDLKEIRIREESPGSLYLCEGSGRPSGAVST